MFGKKIPSSRVDKNMKEEKHAAAVYPLHHKTNHDRIKPRISTDYIHELIYYSETNSFPSIFWVTVPAIVSLKKNRFVIFAVLVDDFETNT